MIKNSNRDLQKIKIVEGFKEKVCQIQELIEKKNILEALEKMKGLSASFKEMEKNYKSIQYKKEEPILNAEPQIMEE